VTYGSNAVHGLINVQSRNAYASNTARILASDDGLVSTMVSIGDSDLRASVSAVHDNGFRDDSGFDQQKFQLKYQGDFGEWSVDSLAGNTLALTPYARRAELRFLRHFVPGQALEKNGHSSVGLQTAYYGDDFNIGVDAEYTDGFLYEFQDNPNRFSFVQGLHYDYDVKAFVGAGYVDKTFEVARNTTLNVGARAEYTAYDYTNNADTGRSGRFIRAADRKDDFLTITPKINLIHANGPAHGSLFCSAQPKSGRGRG